MPTPSRDVVSWKEYVDRLFFEQSKLLDARFASQEKSLDMERIAQAARNLVANEFRGQLADQAQTFMPRAECKSILDSHSSRLDRIEGRAGGSAATTATIIAIVSILIGTVALIAGFWKSAQ